MGEAEPEVDIRVPRRRRTIRRVVAYSFVVLVGVALPSTPPLLWPVLLLAIAAAWLEVARTATRAWTDGPDLIVRGVARTRRVPRSAIAEVWLHSQSRPDAPLDPHLVLDDGSRVEIPPLRRTGRGRRAKQEAADAVAELRRWTGLHA